MTDTLAKIRRYLDGNMVRGWLTPREGELLYKLAGQCPADAVIVEIGSWQGRSTVYLSNGSKAGKKAHIFAVDPHTGPEQAAQDIWTYDIFMNNVAGGGAGELVTPIVKFSADAALDFDKPVGFLFIDGDHSYEAVKTDFEKWYPKVIDGGIIAFHDSIKYDGPRRLLSGVIPGSVHFKSAGIVDSTFFATKVPRNAAWDRLRNRYIMALRRFLEYGAHMSHRLHPPKAAKAIYKKITSLIQGRNI